MIRCREIIQSSSVSSVSLSISTIYVRSYCSTSLLGSSGISDTSLSSIPFRLLFGNNTGRGVGFGNNNRLPNIRRRVPVVVSSSSSSSPAIQQTLQQQQNQQQQLSPTEQELVNLSQSYREVKQTTTTSSTSSRWSRRTNSVTGVTKPNLVATTLSSTNSTNRYYHHWFGSKSIRTSSSTSTELNSTVTTTSNSNSIHSVNLKTSINLDDYTVRSLDTISKSHSLITKTTDVSYDTFTSFSSLSLSPTLLHLPNSTIGSTMVMSPINDGKDDIIHDNSISSKSTSANTFDQNNSQRKNDTRTNRTKSIIAGVASAAIDVDVAVDDIEELHRKAIIENNCSPIYIDPTTGFQVFTEIAHLQRGVCCGNQCRHCPYGWMNVTRSTNGIHKNPKVQSGNKEQILDLLQSYQDEANTFQQKQQQEQQTHDGNEGDNDNGTVSGISPPTSKNNNNDGTSKSKTGGRHGGKYTDKNVPYTRTGDTGTAQLFNGERRRKDDIIFEAMGDIDELCSITGIIYAQLRTISNNTKNEHNQQNNSASSEQRILIDEQKNYELQEWLLDIMSRLFDIGAILAKPHRRRYRHDEDNDDDDDEEGDSESSSSNSTTGFALEHIESLERWIDIMTEILPELKHFILPTGNTIAAQLHVARTVCRRAERRVISCNFSSLTTNDNATSATITPNTTSINTFSKEQVDTNVIKYLNRLSDFYFTAARYVNYLSNDEEIVYRRPISLSTSSTDIDTATSSGGITNESSATTITTDDAKQRQRIPLSYKP